MLKLQNGRFICLLLELTRISFLAKKLSLHSELVTFALQNLHQSNNCPNGQSNKNHFKTWPQISIALHWISLNWLVLMFVLNERINTRWVCIYLWLEVQIVHTSNWSHRNLKPSITSKYQLKSVLKISQCKWSPENSRTFIIPLVNCGK